MSLTLHKLLILQFFFLLLVLINAEDCYAQQIIKIHDPLRHVNDFRYVWGRGETTLMLNSMNGNELYLYLKFSPEVSLPLFLVLFCYEGKVADEGSRAVFEFADGTSLDVKNSGRFNMSSMYLFDITNFTEKFRNLEVSDVYLINQKGIMSERYIFAEHSDYFINFFSLYSKLQENYQVVATSDTIK